jgi:L-2-hydroxyglutarate oxidase LhgO
MNFDFDVSIVGAGIVGLACARAFARSGYSTLVLERHPSFGIETSSRNSEVIHAGIYYPKNSLKAKLCVEGKQLLYEFCQANHVSHQNIGKLIIATSENQLSTLLDIQRKAMDNGVNDLQLLSKTEIATIEPAISCVAGLLSPSTGIIDSHGLMFALLSDAEHHGAMVSFRSNVRHIEVKGSAFCITVGDIDSTSITSRYLIVASGLDAATVAARIKGFDKSLIPPTFFAKGNYFALSGKAPFSRLVYPVPEPGGLGIHFTLDLAGQARFGPDVEWVNEIDYNVDNSRSDGFYNEIRKYWPNIAQGALSPAYAGIRPKLAPSGGSDSDFIIQSAATHGMGNLVNLFGIESPGLTASLAIANTVFTVLTGHIK